jgi:hypothetical protein
MPMVVESTFELEFTYIAAAKVHSFHYNIISTSKTKTSCYFVVVFVCTVQCFTVFFRSNNIRRLKNAFCGCNFSSNLVLKYVKFSPWLRHWIDGIEQLSGVPDMSIEMKFLGLCNKGLTRHGLEIRRHSMSILASCPTNVHLAFQYHFPIFGLTGHFLKGIYIVHVNHNY